MSNIQQTLSIIKPDAVERNLADEIKSFLIKKNFMIIDNKKITKGVLLRGYKKEQFQSLNIVKNRDFSGSKILRKSEISISRELGYDLDLKIGDKLSLVFSSFEETLIGSLPKQKTFKIHLHIQIYSEFNILHKDTCVPFFSCFGTLVGHPFACSFSGIFRSWCLFAPWCFFFYINAHFLHVSTKFWNWI